MPQDANRNAPLVMALRLVRPWLGWKGYYQCVLLPTKEVKYTGNVGPIKGLMRSWSIVWRNSVGDAVGRVDFERVWLHLNHRVVDAANREVLAIDHTRACRRPDCWPEFVWQVADRRWVAKPRLDENGSRFLDLLYEGRLVATIVEVHYIIGAGLMSQHSFDARKILCAVYVHDPSRMDLVMLMAHGFGDEFDRGLE
jgi:hypothetical protein